MVFLMIDRLNILILDKKYDKKRKIKKCRNRHLNGMIFRQLHS
jgi:hypothetical protein